MGVVVEGSRHQVGEGLVDRLLIGARHQHRGDEVGVDHETVVGRRCRVGAELFRDLRRDRLDHRAAVFEDEGVVKHQRRHLAGSPGCRRL